MNGCAMALLACTTLFCLLLFIGAIGSAISPNRQEADIGYLAELALQQIKVAYPGAEKVSAIAPPYKIDAHSFYMSVDGKNSFGGPVRTGFIVSHNGETLTGLKMDN
jgi:hypothetical protein